jgi:hypothetical protein
MSVLKPFPDIAAVMVGNSAGRGCRDGGLQQPPFFPSC